MGVDTHVTFPWGTQVEVVAKAIGILAGLPPTTVELVNGGKSFIAVRVNGASVHGYDTIPTMASIRLHGPMVDGTEGHQAYWHFENHTGPRLDTACTPFWVAIARTLTGVFGGKVDVFDTDDTLVDFSRPKPRAVKWNLDDDDLFDEMQKRLLRLRPIGMDDMVDVARKWNLEFPNWSARPEGIALDSVGKVV